MGCGEADTVEQCGGVLNINEVYTLLDSSVALFLGNGGKNGRYWERSSAYRARVVESTDYKGYAMAEDKKNGTAPLLPVIATQVKERVYGWRRKGATVAVGALALGMGYGVVFGHNGLTVFEQKRQQEKALQRQMQMLQSENERLRGHVDRLQNDPGAIEHQAREELHYTRAGEVIYTLPPDPKPQAGQTASKP